MVSKIKRAVLNCIANSVSTKNLFDDSNRLSPKLILSQISDGKLQGRVTFFQDRNIDIKKDWSDGGNYRNKTIGEEFLRDINFTKICSEGRYVEFQIESRNFVKEVLDSNPTDFSFKYEKNKIAVEYSSPNIAKQFHVGHFRSTIIGNFITNLKKKMGCEVVALNYLGDWGTQCGILIIGLKMLNYSDEEIKQETVSKLNKAYVYGNKMASENDEILQEARNIFKNLEDGDEKTMRIWIRIRENSKRDLEKMYNRLKIKFDGYDWESCYSKSVAAPLLNNMEEKGILVEDKLGRKVVNLQEKEVPLLKSEGTTLYLMRDIMAFFERRKRYNFDKIYYVTDYAQGQHFQNLKRICELIEPNSSPAIHHVQFGRINGMSTREGTGVVLDDLLNEARDRMFKKMTTTRTTKCTPSMETADILGISGLIVNDLRRYKGSHYEFDWESALNMSGNSGVQLQYCHCRLSNIEKHSGVIPASECDPDALPEPEAIQLILDIARFEDILLRVDEKLESKILVDYLFDLKKSTHKAIMALRVKNSEPHLASQRLMLFNSAKSTIAEGMRLLGMQTLEEM